MSLMQEDQSSPFLCLGDHKGALVGIALTPTPERVMFHRPALVIVPDEDAQETNPAWSALVPGVVASGVFQESSAGGARKRVPYAALRIEASDSPLVGSLWEAAYRVSSRTDLLFGYSGRFALPANAIQPAIPWELKCAHSVSVFPWDRSEFRGDTQVRVRFRVGRNHRFNLPLHGPLPAVVSENVERPWLVAVGLTEPFEKGLRYKVVVGAVPIPDSVEISDKKRHAS